MKTWTDRMRKLSVLGYGMILMLALSASPAKAVPDVCVSTQAQLEQAMDDVRYTAQTIKIVQGSYNIEGALWYYYNNNYMQPGTSLRGGYFPGCVARQVDGGNTVLTETQVNEGAELSLVGSFTLEGLTLDLAHGLTIYALNNDYVVEPGTTVLIYRCIIRGGNSFDGVPLWVIWSQDPDLGGGVKIIDTLVVGNSSDSNGYAIELWAYEGAPTWTFTNDTVMGNARGIGIYNNFDGEIGGGGVLRAHNNIFWGNSNGDLFSDTPYLELVDNVIGSHQYPTPNVTPIGTQIGNPQLDAGYHPIESPLSPVINSGDYAGADLPSTDLDGGPRVIGSRVDRGVYESPIEDGFVLTVTNNNDSGTGSLRAAIISANANGAGIIAFNIGSGCGPHVITLSTPLPAITGGVIINGATQPGASTNDLEHGDNAVVCIVLDGGPHSIADGFLVAPGAPASAQLVIDSLAFSGFTDAAVNFSGSKGHSLQGSHIGGSVGGVHLQPSNFGVFFGPGVSNTYIGGTDPASRNIIGDALTDGIRIGTDISANTHANSIINNYIGVGWGGGDFTNRGNGFQGIHVYGNGNTISGNVIGYSGVDGINIFGGLAHNNVVEDNFIGVSDDGVALANASMGVRLDVDSHDNTIRINTIAHNTGTGVRVVSGQGNTIRKNSIFLNGSYGIDLAGGGVTANDDDGDQPAADYANRGQNFPVLTNALGSLHGGTLSGSLTTLPGAYTVDFYSSSNCDGSGYGEGARWLRGVSITVPAATIGDQGVRNFSASFTLPGSQLLSATPVITATATDAAGNTSEFSACHDYLNDVIFANGFN
ncbi:MAG: right-handed parallel beta-helix repeat-containing protein [Dokdonella sp.]